MAIIGGVLAYPSLARMANPDSPNHHVVARLGRTVFNTDFFGIPVSLPEPNAYNNPSQ